MSKSILSLLVAFGLLALTGGQAKAQADPSFPFVYDPASVGLDYTTVCQAPRMHGGLCFWWSDLTAIAGATRSSATFRVITRSKLCMDSAAAGASVQVKEYVTPSTANPIYSVTPTPAVLNGTDCLWLSKGEYWLEATTSGTDKLAVSIREIPE